ncbi:hypothetical protein LTR36_007685 [Oleoguttula mirabilis]|uniref:Mediator of RNA polymerase II transcription subunit 14 n=1 Tax=Oleoguttula mirabilis TaxID=1507867 RepID=A0AAV9JVW5_9PEZI|nr:hypothetical protein LTR36_007685 [Oleoguttula mirabilis]
MDQQSAVGSQDLKKARSHAQGGGVAQQNVGAHVMPGQDTSQTNGPPNHGQNGASPNGVPASNGGVPITNGDHMDTSMALAGPTDPPPLDQSWRETPANKSLGKLMDRVAQQCYHDLNETLTKMAEAGAESDTHQANGILAQGQQDTSETSVAKKRLLLNFASEQRDRFTKTLVLTDWAKNEKDMARLIDIKVWQEMQRWAYTNAATAIGETKLKMIDFKVPAPNIEGAMELLATGKASWIPDLGYIPPKRLTAKQLLKTLKGMNVTLATRLNLHEELPPYMQDFTIADGRATFSVPSEFEVDLSVADEEPASQFYLIDVRFLFSPSSNMLHDELRGHMEARTNQVLESGGLQGCYDFLHNFVLTHKINTLRNQAQDLIRYGKWFECIKVEPMRRSLVVQYWVGMPGPKNWFEIGIASGKQKAGSRKKPTPTVMVRWFRKGREVVDEQLAFDWKKLDLEACLMQVIAKHSLGKLAAAKDGLRVLAPESKVLKTDLTKSNMAPEECILTLGLPSMRSPLVVRLEPVTGQMSITPPSAATLNSERVLNSDPNVEVPRVLASLACQAVQEPVRKQAELLGWQEVQNLVSVRAKLGADVLQRSVFQPPGWGQQWALAVSFSLNGEKWWIVQVKDNKPDDRSNRTLKEITSVRQLMVTDASPDSQLATLSAYSRASLLRIERLAVAEVSYTVLAGQLRTLRIPHQIEKLDALTEGDASAPGPNSTLSATVFVRFSPLMRDKSDKAWKPWAADSLRLTHHGIEDADFQPGELGSVRYDLRLSVDSEKMKHLRKCLTRAHDRDIAINSTGGLAVRLRTPFGEPFVEQIRKRLRNLERLDGYVAVLQRLGFTCTFVSLAKLAFTYSTAPPLSAQLSFASDGSLPVRLQLEPADSNPHLRVRMMLEQGLNGKNADDFSDFAHTLPLTLPLLQTFERLEDANVLKRSFAVRSRSATWYSIAYKAPLLPCAFEVRARAKAEGGKTVVRWHLQETKSRSGDGGVREDFVAALKVFWQEKGEHWFGIGNGIVADSVGISAALSKLDEFVRRFEGSADELAKPADTTTAPSATETAKQSLQQPAKKPGGASKASAAKNQRPDVIMLD